MLQETDYRLLIVPVQKLKPPEVAISELEKLIVYGLQQTLEFYTPLTYVENTSAEPGVAGATGDDLVRLCEHHACQGGLMIKFSPRCDHQDVLYSIQMELLFYDLRTQNVSFQLVYDFDDFETHGATATLSWVGLETFLQWITNHLIGAIFTKKAGTYWKFMQNFFLASNLRAYQKTLQAHYLSAHNGLAQKMTLLESALQDDPKLFLAYLELGKVYKRMNNYIQAIQCFEKAFHLMKDVMPRQRAAYTTELGICYALVDNLEQAFYWWKTAILIDSGYVSPYLNLAHALEESGNLHESARYFVKASEVAPGDARVPINLARIYSKQESWDQAIEQYEQQILLEGDNPWVYSDLANCFLQKGDLDQAKRYLIKTLTADPDGEAGRCAQDILMILQATEA